jgi:hypothetical protein
MTSPPPPPPHKAPLEKLHAALLQPELLDHPGRSHKPLRDDRTDWTQTVLLRAALLELQRSESLPAGPLHLSLSLRPFLAPYACSVSALL